MAKNRNRNRRPARRPPFREPKPLILVVCEGRNTEPQYFEGFRDACANPRVYVEFERGAGVPKTIVDLAKELRDKNVADAKRADDENIIFEQIWCVFDVDDHPNLNQAIDKAQANKLRLAISNEAFELWLLLHFRESPGMKSRVDLRRMLKTFIPDYDKKVEIEAYLEGYFDAVSRAKKMWNDAGEAGGRWNRNPVTNVHELTESIRGNSDLESTQRS